MQGNYCPLRCGRRAVLAAALLLLLAACRREAELPTPSISATRVPIVEVERQEATAVAARLIPPTSEVLTAVTPPLPEPQPSPSAPATLPTETTATAEPPLRVIPGMIGPTDYPPHVNPLTGEQVGDPRVLDRRPLAVKISNFPPSVRPQSGLNNADLVFEHYAEGVTRFTAVFYSKGSDPVGSIRSGRLIDLEIPLMYDAAFGYSGSAAPVREMFRESAFYDRIVSPDFAHGGYYRVEDSELDYEHTLFTNTSTLWYILEERGQNHSPEYPFGMTFHPDAPEGGATATSVEVQYLATNVFWYYNSGTGRYTRWTDGEKHLDALTGTQLNFRNVVVLEAQHRETDILEDLLNGGHYSIEIQLWGEGPATIFRDGNLYEGEWRREDREDMLTFYDMEGNLFPLAPGNTFFQVVPLGFTELFVKP